MEKLDIPTVNHHIGSTERVFVAHVNDLNDFYLHSELHRDSLLKLGQDLYDEYSESLTKQPLGINETFSIGDYCVCPSHSQDWYRGLIRHIDSNGTAAVFKIDYGDVQYTPTQFLQPLHKNFTVQPGLAFHCSLANLIKPLDGWPLDAIEEFCSRLSTTFLYAKFMNYNEVRDMLEVEITEKTSKTSLNTDFQHHQIQRLILPTNDKFLYKCIPFEKLDCNQPNQIRLLYYINPSHFYVYLRDNMNSYKALQKDLQQAVQNSRPISSPTKYQPVAAQDNHTIWHRAVIMDLNSNLMKIAVYYIDLGQRQYTSINSIRLLPEEFQFKPALAIPCRLYKVYPSNSNDQSQWQSDDRVHGEFNGRMVNNVTCTVIGNQDQVIYDVEIDIPKLGDLGKFLSDNNLVSRQQMHNNPRANFSSGQPMQHSFVRAQLGSSGLTPFRPQAPRATQPNEYYNNPNNSAQQPQTRMLNTGSSSTTVQHSPSTVSIAAPTAPFPPIPPPDGSYTITQVHSAAEFYGVSQMREHDLEGLNKHLEEFYNNSVNDQSFTVYVPKENSYYVVQQGDKYYRVLTKHHESDTRILVTLIDRGFEIIVDTTELLQINPTFVATPPFAQRFRLRGYDESQNSSLMTRNLKRLILNQRVRIIVKGSIINGTYPVDVVLADNQWVNRLLFPNDTTLLSPPLLPNDRPGFNKPQHAVIESQVFSNSLRHHPKNNQDSTERAPFSQRSNGNLPTSSNMMSGAPRSQPGRFSSTTDSTASVLSSTKAQIPRFSNAHNRNIQQYSQTADSTASNSMWNKEQNNKTNFGTSDALPNQQSYGRQQSDSFHHGNVQRPTDDKVSIPSNQNRLSSMPHDNQQPASSEQRRTFGGNFSHDNRHEKPMDGNHFQRHDDRTNENNFRQDAGFSNRGSGFVDRRGRGNFNDRQVSRTNDNNNDHNSQSSGSFPRRGRGSADGRGRGGNFSDRNSYNRNQDDDRNDNNMHQSQNFRFQNRRDQEGNRDRGDFGRRGDRGSYRGDGFSNSRGGRGNLRDRDNIGLRLSSDSSNSAKPFGGMGITQPVLNNFEAGDKFIEHDMPKEVFTFVISHIETANDFFIQLLNKGDEILKLSETLQNEYGAAPEATLSSFKIGQACLAKSTDGCWYRATVLVPGSNALKIRFVDFGDTAEVNLKTIKPLAKKHCSAAPYAYQCTFENIQTLNNVNIENLKDQCSGKTFNGKIKGKLSGNKFILNSDDFLKVLLDINAIKLKPVATLKRIPCLIVHIESGQHQFFIQDDKETADKIAEQILVEEPNSSVLSLDEVKQLPPETIVIAQFEDEFYRAVIQSDESADNVIVCYVDFGNTNSCPKTSLKQCSKQLSSYPNQSKRCQLYGILPDKIDDAFTYLQDVSDSENLEISIVKEKDLLSNVLLYADNICVNEKFGCDLNAIETSDTNVNIGDQATTTTVNEQEQPQIPLTIEQPPSVVEQPPSVVEQPPSVVEQPPSVVEQPPSVVEQPPSVVEQPPSVVEQPPSVVEQPPSVVERPPSVVEQPTNDDALSQNEILEPAKSDSNEPKEEEPQCRTGLLTHMEMDKPYIYLQLLPESVPILERIHQLIDKIVVEKLHNSSYAIGDHVVAKFSEDDEYYRARIESYSSTSNLYTVYFLDYGNLDENVTVDHLYSYSDELEKIKPLIRGYLLNQVTIETWTNTIQPIIEEKLNDSIEFTIIDENNSIIDIEFDDAIYADHVQEYVEHIESSIIEQAKRFTANISATDKDSFYIHILPDDNLRVCELEEYLKACDKQRKHIWAINDRCIVSNDQEQFYRGQILAIDDNKYHVKCIDYGNTLENIDDGHLFVLSDITILEQLPLAQQCRLYGIDDSNQIKVINDIIKNIPTTECVTVDIENDENYQVWLVKLTRENNDTINDHYLSSDDNILDNENTQGSNNNEIIVPDSPAPANIDEQKTSEIDVPQMENNTQPNDIIDASENNSVVPSSNNQAIDLGEYDSSATNTTITDETNTSISSD
ncbi:unnamed protein product [Rotaria socialis]|uniref:Tudor domain-containing protein n=1 Tax=Rotaria socialis TaxID=392032 RepID=A0A817YAF8_9BILA|nr:unnamed protein product [Rotaria socialis]CAF4134184.1 unnamed protein product [Rotaria socialis]